MIEGGSFNIQNTLKPTNKDLIVVFSPAQNIKLYTYIVYQDGHIIETSNVNNNKETSIHLTETGKYKITIKAYDINNKEININSGEYTIDKEAPIITVNQKEIKFTNKEPLPNNIVTAKDNYSGNLTNKITSNIDSLNLNKIGTKTLTYTVSDEAGNIATQNINLTISNNQYYFYTAQIIVFAMIFSIILLMARFAKTLNIANRIEQFTITPLKNTHPSLLDRVVNWYTDKLNNWTKKFEKSVIAKKYSKQLNKYASISSIHHNGTEIFISKLITSFLFILIAIITKIIEFKTITPSEIYIPFLIGFFLLDILYFIKYKLYRAKLENDLLSAIIIMNNAFKAGRSIVQAISIVSEQMTGQMAKEFSKMSLELSYGLEIDTVFKRFFNRIKLNEINYLTSSLTILNKTGGNIIEVLSSIEKTMFNKKKLKLELKSLTSSSKIIVYTLFIVPFLFIIFVSFISPGYFSPFINTKVGHILLIIMIIYYLIFIYSVRKIMKVVI